MAVNVESQAQEEIKEEKQMRKQRLIQEALHEFHINPKFADCLHYIIETKEEQLRNAVTAFERDLSVLRDQQFKLREEIFDEVDDLVDKHFKECY